MAKSKLGRDINPDELICLIKNAGKRAVISSPTFRIVADNHVAIAENVNVTFGG